jgi:hypothetical protein
MDSQVGRGNVCSRVSEHSQHTCAVVHMDVSEHSTLMTVEQSEHQRCVWASVSTTCMCAYKSSIISFISGDNFGPIKWERTATVDCSTVRGRFLGCVALVLCFKNVVVGAVIVVVVVVGCCIAAKVNARAGGEGIPPSAIRMKSDHHLREQPNHNASTHSPLGTHSAKPVFLSCRREGSCIAFPSMRLWSSLWLPAVGIARGLQHTHADTDIVCVLSDTRHHSCAFFMMLNLVSSWPLHCARSCASNPLAGDPRASCTSQSDVGIGFVADDGVLSQACIDQRVCWRSCCRLTAHNSTTCVWVGG